MPEHYNVYLVGTGYGCFRKDYAKIFLGDTWAISVKQAISNIRWRLRQQHEEIPGGLEDSEGMGYVVYTLRAEKA